jgi:DNA-binding response OmpR family regulator
MSATPSMILVVDDEESILEAVTFSLEHEGYRTAVALTGDEALRRYQEVKPQLVVLDVMLPDRSGFEVCRDIRVLGDTPILFLTARDQLDDRVTGLDMGGDDYLPKPFKFREFLARVRALLRRSGHSNRVLSCGELILDPDTRMVMYQGRPVHLTLREYEVLELLLRRPRQVFTRQQILRQLWGWSDDIETNVVEVHISALRAKFQDTSRTLIRTVRGVGYALG